MSNNQNRNLAVNLGLTNKQQAAVSRAPANQRARLRRAFQQQRRTPWPAGNQPRRRATMAVPRMLPPAAQAPRRRGAQQQQLPPTGLKLAKMWDPLNPTPIPTAVSDGHAHVTTGMDRFDIQVGTGSKVMVIVSNTGSSGCGGVIFDWNTNGVNASSFVFPTLQGSALSGGGPTAGRAMKSSLSILNSTPTRKIGGTVSFLNATQRIVWPTDTAGRPSTISVAQANDLFLQIKKQQQTVIRTGEFYKTPKTCFAYPGNEAEYISFQPFQSTTQALNVPVETSLAAEVDALEDVERFLYSVSTAAPYNPNTEPTEELNARAGEWEPKRRPMSSLIFLIDAPPEPQSYTFTVRGSYYTRWPMEHVLGQHHPPIPSSSPGVVSHLRDAGEHFGQVMHDLSDTVGSVGQGISRAIGTAFQAKSMYDGFQAWRNTASGALSIAAPIVD